MTNFENIPIKAKWSEIASLLNTNFSLAYAEFVKLTTATTKSKGLYPTEAALTSAIPNPVVGDWANVGNTIPSKVYVCISRGVWTDSGTTGGGAYVELTDYVKNETFASAKAIIDSLGLKQSELEQENENVENKLKETDEQIATLGLKTSEISKEEIETNDESIDIEDNNGNNVFHLDENGLDAKNVKSNGKDVLTEDNISEYLNGKQDIIPQIGKEEIETEEEIYVFASDDYDPDLGTGEVYAIIDPNGLHVKTLTDLSGNPIEFNRTFVVDKNGEYDFTSLSEAIIEAVKYVGSKVIVNSGEYDIINEFKSIYGNDFFDTYNSDTVITKPGLFLINGVHVIFSSGAKVLCNYTGNNSKVMDLFSPFNAQAWDGRVNNDFTLENMIIDASNVRYVVHDEMGGNTHRYTHKYIGCNMTLDNTNSNPKGTSFQYEQCIGGGLGKNGEIVIESCYFSSKKHESVEGAAVSYHNAAMADAKSSLVVKDCYFAHKGTFRLSWYGSSTKITEAKVCGNKLGADIIHNAEGSASIKNTNVLSWNNNI